MSDLITGIYPSEPKHEDVVERRIFQPWHKPRKQYVRQEQWCKESNSLIQRLLDRLSRDKMPLSYLSLPGADMLDLRLLSDLCHEYELSIRFLGFNTRGTDANISWQEVSPAIVPTSVISPSDFADLANKDSLAYSHLQKLGPFDIVNMDFCQSAASHNNAQPYHTAFKNLFELQINQRSEPWLFFTTMRCDDQSVSQDVMEQYKRNVYSNIRESHEFKESLVNHNIPVDGQNEVGVIQDEKTRGYYFSICFGKWLLGIFNNVQSRWNVKMLDSYWYKVQPSATTPDMVSLAFLIEPVEAVLADPSGLVPTAELQVGLAAVSEVYQAINVVEKSFCLKDIDIMLRSDSGLAEEMIKKSGNLMEQARYNRANYERWARGWGFVR